MRIIGLLLLISHVAGSHVPDDDELSGSDESNTDTSDEVIEGDQVNVGTQSHHDASISNHNLPANLGQVGAHPKGANDGLYDDSGDMIEESADHNDENSGSSSEQSLEDSGNSHQAEDSVDPETLAEQAVPVINSPDPDAALVHDSSSTLKISNPISAELSQLLSQLYGKAVTDFAKDPDSYEENVLEIDCRDRGEDFDWKVNIVTTLCPFLRDDDDSCGLYRHSSFAAVNPTKLCSDECTKNIDAIMSALPMRKFLALHPTRKYEASIFRAIVNSILLQYASQCRVGTWFMPN